MAASCISQITFGAAQATPVLIWAGTVNGVLMPVVFGVVLIAAHRPNLMGAYRHPRWIGAYGALVWAVTVYLAYRAVR